MKQFFSLSVIAVMLFTLVSSCGEDPKSALMKVNKDIYKQALRFSDINVATHAIYNIMALSPNDSSYLDSLCMLYFNGRASLQCINVGMSILENNPNDTTILEMVAISKQAIGALKEAHDDYEKLYGMSNKAYHLYQMASINYNLKRLTEAQTAINQLAQHPDFEKEEVNITYGQGKNQKVPMTAAVWNIQGVLALENKDAATAQQAFAKAVELYPEFILAKSNLEALEKQAQGGGQ